MRRWLRVLLLALAGIVLVAGAAFALVVRPPADYHDGDAPRFATSDIMPFENVSQVSRFRSGAGHDFSTGPESCRSMKHYVAPIPVGGGDPYANRDERGMPIGSGQTVEIRSPIEGVLTSISNENTPIGKQLSIRSTQHPAYDVRLFHVDPAPGIHALARVHAGQVVGTIDRNSDTDVAVEVLTWRGTRFASFYDLLSDPAFAPYAAHNITRQDLILTREWRDAHPLTCDPNDPQERFVGHRGDSPEDWVYVDR